MKLNVAFAIALLVAATAAAYVGQRNGPTDVPAAYGGPHDTIVFARSDLAGEAIYLSSAKSFASGDTFRDARKIAVQSGSILKAPTFVERPISFAWTPDGRRIYYLVYRFKYGGGDDRIDLWSINTDGTDPQQRIMNFMPLDPAGFVPRYPLWALIEWSGNGYEFRRVNPSEPPSSYAGSKSPDGRRVVYRWAGIDIEVLCINDAVPPDEVAIPQGDCVGGGFYSLPAWSPE